jgi:hypothetical protein
MFKENFISSYPSICCEGLEVGVTKWACAKFVGGEISSPLGIPKTLPSGH